MEYHCPVCYHKRLGRQFKVLDADDHCRDARASDLLRELEHALVIPDDEIPPGDETSRLLRWGYRRYREMFGDRQLLALGLLLRRINSVQEPRIRHTEIGGDFVFYVLGVIA